MTYTQGSMAQPTLLTIAKLRAVAREIGDGPSGPAEVYCSDWALVLVQFRFPRSKRKRIRTKWQKIPGNNRRIPGILYVNGKIHAHPEMFEKIREAFNRPQPSYLNHIIP